MAKKILVLGGGYGGVLTAKHLARKIKKQGLADTTVTLIDQNPFHTMLTELHEVAAGRVPEDAIRLDFRKIFAGREVELVRDRIGHIDLEQNCLEGEEGSYPYDYLVVGAGSKPAFYGTPGAEEHTFSLWSYDDAVRLRNQIAGCFRRAMAENDGAKRRQLLTFVVAGAGFTGAEMAGELAEYLPVLCKRYSIAREETRLLCVDIIDRMIPTLPEKLSAKVRQRLERMGGEVLLSTAVSSVETDFVELKTGDKVQRIPTETVIWTAGIEAASALEDTAFSRQCRGRVETDAFLAAKGYDNVYVVGDNLHFIPEGEKHPVPQMVENAEHSSKLVAHNLLCALTGQPGDRKPYNPSFHGVMVCVGGRWGTAYVGAGERFFSLPSFLAMFVKHFINLIYFLQVMGFTKCMSYLRHEFFQIENRRSFVGGHLARSAPNFWLAPLRVFLGIMWLIEFSGKWPKFIANPSNIFLFTLPSTDSVTSATTASAEATGQVYGTPLPVPGFITDIVDWTMGVFVAPIAPFVQGAMIIAELLVGLALIAGLLTVPALLVSMAMCAMIYSSGMASKDILWYFFISLGLLGGGGSVFSFDYYFLPWLKRWWNSRRLVRKWYLYME